MLAAAGANASSGLPTWHCCSGGCLDPTTGEVSYGACEKDYSNGVGCGAANPNQAGAAGGTVKPAGAPWWTAAQCRANLGGDSAAACGAPVNER